MNALGLTPPRSLLSSFSAAAARWVRPLCRLSFTILGKDLSIDSCKQVCQCAYISILNGRQHSLEHWCCTQAVHRKLY